MNVLVITTTFPPRGGSSVQRVSKFVKFSRANGVNCFVVTSAYKGKMVDESLSRDVRNQCSISFIDNWTAESFRRAHKVARRFIWQEYPDEFWGWRAGACRESRRICDEHDIDAVLVSYGALSSLLVAKEIATERNLPLVVDVRDLKTKNRFNSTPLWRASARQEQAVYGLELNAFCRADMVTVVSEHYKALLENQFLQPPEKVRVIFNGYDADDFEGTGRSRKEGLRSRPIIRYMGFVTHLPSFESLLRALVLLNTTRSAVGQDEVKLETYGGGNRAQLSEMISRCGAREFASVQEYVEHTEATKLMCEARVLVLLQHAENGVLPAKTFEYIGAGRPVLLLNNQNIELEHLVRNYRLGEVADCGDVEAIAERLEFLISENFSPQSENPVFRREFQARQFADAIAGAVESRKGTT